MNSVSAGCAVKKIKVLLANRPRLMRELLFATISDQPDIEIVGEIEQDADIEPFLDRAQPDFLVIAMTNSGERPSLCDHILERHPHVKILAIAPDSNISMFYWASLDIHSTSVEASEEGLLSTLRNSPQMVGGEA